MRAWCLCLSEPGRAPKLSASRALSAPGRTLSPSSPPPRGKAGHGPRPATSHRPAGRPGRRAWLDPPPHHGFHLERKEKEDAVEIWPRLSVADRITESPPSLPRSPAFMHLLPFPTRLLLRSSSSPLCLSTFRLSGGEVVRWRAPLLLRDAGISMGMGHRISSVLLCSVVYAN